MKMIYPDEYCYYDTENSDIKINNFLNKFIQFAWFGLVWFGLVWFGLVWFGLI
jgi:hypothetical protein